MPDNNIRVLWADDEIDLLKPHILFLESKGYEVKAVPNGEDAVALVGQERFDVVLLDEMMPGLGGLGTLAAIKEIDPSLQVVMITKSEEERLMNEALGKRIADYLIKPVNPSQIWLALKRLTEGKQLVAGQFTRDYVMEFNRLQQARMDSPGIEEWVELYVRMTHLERELFTIEDAGLKQTHLDTRKEMNADFCRWIDKAYRNWCGGGNRPLMSVDVVRKFVAPHLEQGKRVYLIVIDCMRLDQWYTIQPLLDPLFDIRTDCYLSILPTATPYSRNAIFAGLWPVEIAQKFPKYWQEASNDERSKNRYEKELLEEQIKRLKLSGPIKYSKVYHPDEANNVRRELGSYSRLPLVALVFNFLDILAHGRSDSPILQELAPDEAAFRSLLYSWFTHSAVYDILKGIAEQDAVVVITTDHGAVVGKRAALIYGNRDTSTNLRYKYGVNLVTDEKMAMVAKNPTDLKLPNEYLNKNYVFAKEDYYFVYPTNFHEYERQYRNSFQHGGISLEEMILPVATLVPKR
jgi:DNA-binding response OmpR family regulator